MKYQDKVDHGEAEERGRRMEVSEELKKFLTSRLPGIGISILGLLTEKGLNISKILVKNITDVLRKELRQFLRSIDVIGLMKKVLLDTAVEIRVEVTFKDKSEKKSEVKKKR